MPASSFVDHVKIATATTGTGTMTLGAAISGFAGSSALTNGAVYSYVIVDGTNWEVGQGTYTSSGTTLSRTTVDASSNAGSKIALSGTAFVAITVAARDLNAIAAVGNWTPGFTFGNSSAGFGYLEQTGYYTKFVNGMVEVVGWCAGNVKGSGTGLFEISLPFAVAGSSSFGNLLAVFPYALAATYQQICLVPNYGTSRAYLYNYDPGNSISNGVGLTNTAWTLTNCGAFFAGQYMS